MVFYVAYFIHWETDSWSFNFNDTISGKKWIKIYFLNYNEDKFLLTLHNDFFSFLIVSFRQDLQISAKVYANYEFIWRKVHKILFIPVTRLTYTTLKAITFKRTKFSAINNPMWPSVSDIMSLNSLKSVGPIRISQHSEAKLIAKKSTKPSLHNWG